MADKKKAGRPTDYDPEHDQLAFNYCKLGAEDKNLAEFFKVCVATIQNWKNDHPSFLDSVKRGKDIFDVRRVEGALIHSALGYSHQSEKIFYDKEVGVVRAETTEHYPPNPASLIFFLKNRDKSRWRDKLDHEHAGPNDGPIQYESVVDRPPPETPQQWEDRVRKQLEEKAKTLQK